ncbi:MAG: hypothetical protein AAF700_10835 [Pseudomonadota bacterium]
MSTTRLKIVLAFAMSSFLMGCVPTISQESVSELRFNKALADQNQQARKTHGVDRILATLVDGCLSKQSTRARFEEVAKANRVFSLRSNSYPSVRLEEFFVDRQVTEEALPSAYKCSASLRGQWAAPMLKALRDSMPSAGFQVVNHGKQTSESQVSGDYRVYRDSYRRGSQRLELVVADTAGRTIAQTQFLSGTQIELLVSQ